MPPAQQPPAALPAQAVVGAGGGGVYSALIHTRADAVARGSYSAPPPVSTPPPHWPAAVHAGAPAPARQVARRRRPAECESHPMGSFVYVVYAYGPRASG